MRPPDDVAPRPVAPVAGQLELELDDPTVDRDARPNADRPPRRDLDDDRH